MKKIIALGIVSCLLFAAPINAEESKLTFFNDFYMFTPFRTLSQTYPELKMDISYSADSTTFSKDMLLDAEGTITDEPFMKGLQVSANSNFDNLNIAGYNVDSISMKFSYAYEDCKILFCYPDLANLRWVQYSIDTDNIKKDSENLIAELNSIYGEYDSLEDITDVNGNPLQYIIWENDYNTFTMKIYDYDETIQPISDDKIYLSYLDNDLDKILQEMQDTYEAYPDLNINES